MVKHAAKFTLVEGIGNIFNALGKMAIAASTTCIGFVMIYYWKSVREQTPQFIAPLLVIFMVGFIVGSVFISVYSTSSNTILQCFLVDLDISEQRKQDGAQHRPDSLKEFIELIEVEPSEQKAPPK